MIGYGKQSINKKDIDIVTKTLKSNYLTQGPAVKKFEDKLKKKFKSKFAFTTNNGTSALHLIGRVLNWKKGDIVIVSPITFLASVNAVLYCGAIPKFVDINLEDYTIDIKKLEDSLKKFKQTGKRVKAVIVTDYAGHPADWINLLRLKNKFNFKLVNDNCHAVGASINKNRGYAVKFADLVSLSFHPVKHITTAEGGAILTNNKFYADKISLLRSHGVKREKKKLDKIGLWYQEMVDLGYNYRLSDVQAALGLSQIDRLEKFLKKRKLIANFYNKIFFNNNKFQIPKVKKNFSHSYHLYPLLVDFKKVGLSKKEVFRKFLEQNIKLQVHYIPVNMQPYYKKKIGYTKKNFVNSIDFYKREISLPIYYDLSQNELEHIKKVCKKIFNI